MAYEDDSTQHTVAYKLAYYMFNYSIPGIHFYTQEYLDNVGLVSTGNKADDMALLKNRIDTRGTILEIARHHAQNHSVMLQNPQDSVVMYEIANTHLHNWKTALARETNLPEVPIEELEMLEEFCESIYQIARRYKPTVKERQSIATRLRGMGGGGASSALRKGISTGRPETVIPAPGTDNKPIPEHHPVIDSIMDYYTEKR